MIETMMLLATDPATPWLVLAGAGGLLAIEAIRSSRRALWGDFFADEFDDD